MATSLFERPQQGEKALLVHVNLSTDYIGTTGDVAKSLQGAKAEEFTQLAEAAGAQIICQVKSNRHKPDAKYFIGIGKVRELADLIKLCAIELVLFDHSLSPSQERDLERALKCRVLDRTGLILDIFASRAHTFEGKLQVELAQLKHIATRLVRGWTHLERQQGGIGTRGPGEAQLETDRRLLRARIKFLEKRLAKVSRQRHQSRASREKNSLPVVSLVGYTNAGKSTLFNTLTAAKVLVKDQLFATLDPTMRKLELPNNIQLILIDTVGFVRDLPHDLVAAFRSTLEETRRADLLLHVVDTSDDMREQQQQEVNQVLQLIGAADVNQILVFNKIDLAHKKPSSKRNKDGQIAQVHMSAATGAGVELLHTALMDYLSRDYFRASLLLAPTEGRLRAKLYQRGVVVDESQDEEGNSILELLLNDKISAQLKLQHRIILKNSQK